MAARSDWSRPRGRQIGFSPFDFVAVLAPGGRKPPSGHNKAQPGDCYATSAAAGAAEGVAGRPAPVTSSGRSRRSRTSRPSEQQAAEWARPGRRAEPSAFPARRLRLRRPPPDESDGLLRGACGPFIPSSRRRRPGLGPRRKPTAPAADSEWRATGCRRSKNFRGERFKMGGGAAQLRPTPSPLPAPSPPGPGQES